MKSHRFFAQNFGRQKAAMIPIRAACYLNNGFVMETDVLDCNVMVM